MNLTTIFPAANFTTAGEDEAADVEGDSASGPSNCFTIYEADSQYFVHSEVDRILTTVIMPVIMIVGVVGNLAVIYAFLRVKSLRTVTNYYLISLALADLVYLCLAIPYTMQQYFHSPVPNDSSLITQAGCKAIYYVTDTLLLVSCLTIIVVSAERYLAICWPMQFRAVRNHSYVAITCLGCWAVAALGKVPTAFYTYQLSFCINWDISQELPYYPMDMAYCIYCDIATKGCEVYSNIDQVTYLLAIPFLTVVYLLIVVELRHGQETSVAVHGSSLQRNKQVVRMLLITVLVYVVCVAPFRIINLLNFHGKVGQESLWSLVQASRIAAHINAAANPVIYNLTSRTYRKAFLKAFPMLALGKKTPGVSSIHPILMESQGAARNKSPGKTPTDTPQTQRTQLPTMTTAQ